ncbi:Mu-like prophage major head subunit gpT family protein [Candidatus Hepatincolaceae symbiont of Richtersius coronifer]
MAITFEKIQDLSTTVILQFQKGLENYKPVYKTIAPIIISNGSSNIYPLGDLPTIKEWLEGDERQLKSIKESKYIIVNKKFEATVKVPRTAIEDDAYNFYMYNSQALGKEAAQHPDKLVAEALVAGFVNGKSYDDVNFFSSSHPGLVPQNNLQAGTEEPWVLIDASKNMPALFHQERTAYKMEKPADLSEHTFLKDEYLFGIRGRGAIGYGLWQLAFGSQAPLNGENFEDAVAQMMSIQKSNGNMVGAKPTHISVGPHNYIRAKKLFQQLQQDGTSNIWSNEIEIVFLPFLTKAESKGKVDNKDNVKVK